MGARVTLDQPNALDVDVMVYSSHKSGTQTLISTLRHASIRCVHLHNLKNIDLQPDQGQFRGYLRDYLAKTGRRLIVLSTFREPLERHISSLFQWHGIGVVRTGQVAGERETLIARLEIDELIDRFVAELRDGSLVGFRDSLHQICRETGMPTSNLNYSADRGYGAVETDLLTLYTFRFDDLFASFPEPLNRALRLSLLPRPANLGANKWYATKYADFKQRLRLPRELVESIYAAKQDLIDVFYPGRYADMLRAACQHYCDREPPVRPRPRGLERD